MRDSISLYPLSPQLAHLQPVRLRPRLNRFLAPRHRFGDAAQAHAFAGEAQDLIQQRLEADRHETSERPVPVPRRPVWVESGVSGSRAAGFGRNIMCLKELYSCYQSESTVLGAQPHLPPIFDVS